MANEKNSTLDGVWDTPNESNNTSLTPPENALGQNQPSLPPTLGGPSDLVAGARDSAAALGATPLNPAVDPTVDPAVDPAADSDPAVDSLIEEFVDDAPAPVQTTRPADEEVDLHSDLDKEILDKANDSDHDFNLDDFRGERTEDSQSTTESQPVSSSKSDSMGSWLPVILIGVVAALALISLLSWLFLRKKRSVADVPTVGLSPEPDPHVGTTGPPHFHPNPSEAAHDLVDPAYDPFDTPEVVTPASVPAAPTFEEPLPVAEADDEEMLEILDEDIVLDADDLVQEAHELTDAPLSSAEEAPAMGFAQDGIPASVDKEWMTWSKEEPTASSPDLTSSERVTEQLPEWMTWSKDESEVEAEISNALELVDPDASEATAQSPPLIPSQFAEPPAVEAPTTVIPEPTLAADVPQPIDADLQGPVTYDAVPPTKDEPEWEQAWTDPGQVAVPAAAAGLAASFATSETAAESTERSVDNSDSQFAEALADSRAELQRVIEQRDGLAVQRDEAQARINELEQQAYEQYNTRDGLIQQCTEIQGLHDALRVEHDAMQTTNRSLVSELESLRAAPSVETVPPEEVAQLRREQAELQSERDRLSTERSSLESERQDIATDRERLEAERQDISSDRERFETERRDFASDHERFEVERRDLEADRQRLEAERKDILEDRERLEATQKEFAGHGDLDAERQDIANDRERIAEERRDLNADRERLEVSRTDLHNDRERFESERHDLNTDRERVEAERHDLNNDRERFEADRRLLAEDLERAEAAKREFESERESWAGEHAGFLAERDQFTSQLASHADHEENVSRLNEELNGLRVELEDSTRLRNELQSEIKKLNLTREETQSLVVEKEEAIYRVTVEKDDLSTQLEASAGRCRELEEEMAQIRDELAGTTAAANQHASELTGQLQTHQQRTLSLESSLRETEAELAIALSAIEDAKLTSADLDKERELRVSLESNLDELKVRAENAEVQIAEALARSEEEQVAAKAEVTRLTEENAELVQRISSIEEQLSTAEVKARTIVEAAAQQTEERLGRLATERDTAIRAWGAAEQRATEIQTELRDSQGDLDSLRDQHQSLVEQMEASQTYRFRVDRLVPAADLQTQEHPLAEVQSLREALENTRQARDEALRQVDELYSPPTPDPEPAPFLDAFRQPAGYRESEPELPPAIDVGPAFGNGFEHDEPLFETSTTVVAATPVVDDEPAEVERLKRELQFARRKADELQRSHDLMASELHRDAGPAVEPEEFGPPVIEDIELEPESFVDFVDPVEVSQLQEKDATISDLREVVAEIQQQSSQREDSLRNEFAQQMEALQSQLAGLTVTKKPARKSTRTKRTGPASATTKKASAAKKKSAKKSVSRKAKTTRKKASKSTVANGRSKKKKSTRAK